MTRRLMSFLLALVLILGILPATASADTNDLGMRPLEKGEEYTQMVTSQNMVDLIRDYEGFSSTPYWDVSQWSIGYGSACGYDKSKKPDLVLTEEEAEQMLMKDLEEKYGKTVNDYCASIKRQPSQQQFDALVDFTYNLGGSWTDGCWLTDWLENPTTEMDFVNAIGRWGRVASRATYSTCIRRIREAIVFLHGEYYLAYGNSSFETDLEVVSNHDLPYYKLVIFQANGGNFGNVTDEIRYYRIGDTYGSFQIPQREGYILTGWEVIAENYYNVDQRYPITTSAVVEKNLELGALWEEDPAATEPTETEPVETEPVETEPVETEPVETEPVETEPVETEPVETEPVETEPVETEPVETEPVETEPVETEPVETEPVETEPVETEPVETEPVETEPVETEPTEPEPTEPEEKPNVPDGEVDLPFTDVPKNAWFRKPVEFVYQNGYMSGMSATSFGPKTSVTRGMMVTVLYRIAGSPQVSSSARKHFSDTQGKYYTDAVGWAWENELVTGMGKNQFGPNYKLTRQDAMTIFYRYCVYHLGMDGTCSGDLSDFDDAHRVSSYAELPVSWAVDVGLMSGLADGNKLLLNPRGYLTRAEAATVLRALVTKILEIA